jgi:hypothetical protein
MSMTGKKDLVIQEEIHECLKHISSINNNKSRQEQLLKLLEELQITFDDPIFEDSIDGTRIRATSTIEISRKGRGGAREEQGEENVIRFQYIKEIHIDYSKVPIKIRDDNDTTYSNDITQDPIIESYDTLTEKSIPTLCEILGLLKRIYFIPEDFSNRLAVDRIHKLRNIFSKDEILTFPSIAFDDNTGIIPI